MKKRILACLLALITLLATACGTESSAPQATTEAPAVESLPGATEEPATEPASVILAQDKSTEYSIYALDGDVALAWIVRSVINDVCGAKPAVVTLKADQTPGEGAKILVGALAESLCQAPAEGSYALSVAEGLIGIRATDDLGAIALENDLRRTHLRSDGNGAWGIYEQKTVASLKGALQNQPEATFHFIYDPSIDGVATHALMMALSFKNESGYGAQVHTANGSYPNRVYIGNVKNSPTDLVKDRIGAGEYFAGVVDGAIVLYSDTALGYFFALEHLFKNAIYPLKEGAESAVLEAAMENYANAPRDESYAATIAFANRLSGTYSNHAERAMATSSNATAADKADHQLVNDLKVRMGNSLILQLDNNLALHDGYIHRLDPKNHLATAFLKDGHVYVPKAYAEVYFGTTLTADADGNVDLSAYCAATAGYTLEHHATSGIVFVLPEGVESFLNLSAKVNGHSNLEYMARIKKFLNNPYLPEPENSIESTRVVVGQVDPGIEAKYFYDYVYNEKEDGVQCLYTPAVLAVTENGKNVLYASYEHVYLGTGSHRSVLLKRSEDDGKTWTTVAEYPNLYHQSLFTVNGKIYNIGCASTFFVSEYDPATGASRSKLFNVKYGNGSSNTVLIANGRVYRCFNNAVVSASVDSDLLVLSNWTISNDPNKFLTKERYIRVTGETPNTTNFRIEEGNVVMGPDGQIYAMYRIDAAPSHKTAFVFTVSADGKTVAPIEEREGIVAFPSSQTKFSLIYDAELKLYVTITSLPTHNTVTMQRNCLGFLVSKDLVHWEVIDSLLVDRAMVADKYSYWLHGFQYVDFTVQGENLYFFVREANHDSFVYHDANYMTLYTIENFRDFVRERLS